MAARTAESNDEVIVCPVCGYHNDPGNWRCQGRITVRGDDRQDCRKDLTNTDPTAEREDFEIHGPGGSR